MENNKSFPTDHIWCVIPVYNNKDTVYDIAIACRSRLSQVVVVDDGSVDTDISALFSNTDIVVLRHKRNRGKGSAILTALRYIKDRQGRFMITIDADGQHYPHDLEKFIPLLQDDEAVIVIGSRTFQSKNIPQKSLIGRMIANFWLRVETGVTINDCQSGFRAYPVHYLAKLTLNGSRYDFETEVLSKAAWAGLCLKTVAIDVWYPEPQSRVSSFRPLMDNIRISLMHTRLVVRRLLPFPHRKLVSSAQKRTTPNIIFHPVKLLKALLKENATPAGLAMSAAIGIFLAVLPLVGIHTLLILYVATRLHLNLIMAVNIQHICMPPFVPVACIELGHYLRYGHWLTDVSYKVIVGQLTERLFEWLLGSFIIAPVAAVIMGFIIFFAARVLLPKKVTYEREKAVTEN